MKTIKLLFIIILFTNYGIYSQKQQETFVFKSTEIVYNVYSYVDEGIEDFYIVIEDANINNEFANELENCNTSLKNKRFYVISIPENVKGQDDADCLFLEFLTHVLGRTKLVDSNLYVVSAKNYTGLYKKVRNENDNIYQHTYLNEIKGTYSSVCESLK